MIEQTLQKPIHQGQSQQYIQDAKPAASFSRTDQLAKHDLLGTEHYHIALKHFMLQCDTPTTIGIEGEWGSGKSSFMNRVQRAIYEDYKEHEGKKLQDLEACPPYFFHFESWRFAVVSDKDLGRRFFQVLLKDLNAKLDARYRYGKDDYSDLNPDDKVEPLSWGAWFWAGVKHWFRWFRLSYWRRKWRGKALKLGQGLIKILSSVSAPLVEGATRGVVKAKHIKSLFNAIGKQFEKKASSYDDLLLLQKEIFSQYVNEVLKEIGRERLIIFVDDIDRLPPAHAVELLEYLKNFLDVEHCVFIIAYDGEFLKQGIREKFKLSTKSKKEEEKAIAFFNKIIQTPFRMPVGRYDVKELLYAYLDIGFGTAPDHRLTVKNSIQAIGSPNASKMFDSFVVLFRNLCELSTGRNPRNLKRFLNGLDLLLYAGLHNRNFPSVDSPTGERHRAFMEEFIKSSIFYACQLRWEVVVSDLRSLEEADEKDLYTFVPVNDNLTNRYYQYWSILPTYLEPKESEEPEESEEPKDEFYGPLQADHLSARMKSVLNEESDFTKFASIAKALLQNYANANPITDQKEETLAPIEELPDLQERHSDIIKQADAPSKLIEEPEDVPLIKVPPPPTPPEKTKSAEPVTPVQQNHKPIVPPKTQDSIKGANFPKTKPMSPKAKEFMVSIMDLLEAGQKEWIETLVAELDELKGLPYLSYKVLGDFFFSYAIQVNRGRSFPKRVLSLLKITLSGDIYVADPLRYFVKLSDLEEQQKEEVAITHASRLRELQDISKKFWEEFADLKRDVPKGTRYFIFYFELKDLSSSGKSIEFLQLIETYAKALSKALASQKNWCDEQIRQRKEADDFQEEPEYIGIRKECGRCGHGAGLHRCCSNDECENTANGKEDIEELFGFKWDRDIGAYIAQHMCKKCKRELFRSQGA